MGKRHLLIHKTEINRMNSTKKPLQEWHFHIFYLLKAKKKHISIKKNSKNLQESQKYHNFAAEYRVNWLQSRRKIAPAMR